MSQAVRVADTKNWTFVLSETCPQCQVDIRDIPAEQLADRLSASIDQWSSLLQEQNPSRGLTSRPSPQVWSPVEYACHVADVMDLFQERIYLMITEDHPTFPSWDPESAAAGYSNFNADQAVKRLEGAANRLGSVFSSMAPHLWSRTGKRADGFEFSILTLSRYFMHDNLHHLNDVAQILDPA